MKLHELANQFMRKLFSIVTIFLILLPAVSSMGVEPNTYYCVTERLVGIQPEELPGSINKEDKNAVYKWNKSNRMAGSLKSIKEKFIIKINEYIYDEAKHGNLSTCGSYTAGLSSTLKCSGSLKYEAELPKEKRVDKLTGILESIGEDVGIDKYLFSSDGEYYINNHTFFIINFNYLNNNYSYTLASLNEAKGNYVEEGNCEIFE